MRRYLRSSAVNVPVAPWGYTRVMMTNRILTICAAASAVLVAAAVGTSLASAQTYPPPGAYSPQPYPQGYPADDRGSPRPMDFDVLEDDEGPNGLPPPGPVPPGQRYGRPVYSDQGPVMSPDDPRYGRPAGPPPSYVERGPVMSPDDPRYG